MLQLSPAETIIFQKNTSNNELIGNVHILNVSKKVKLSIELHKHMSANRLFLFSGSYI